MNTSYGAAPPQWRRGLEVKIKAAWTREASIRVKLHVTGAESALDISLRRCSQKVNAVTVMYWNRENEVLKRIQTTKMRV